jgi:hypothetical protein
MGLLRIAVALTTVTLLCPSCATPPVEIYVDLSFLVINGHGEEILAVCEPTELGLIGFFMQPDEEYLYEYVGLLDKDAGDEKLRLPFEFYAPGSNRAFDEFLCAHIFEIKVYDGCIHADTFRVQQ